jgi:hypothetical protein
MINKNARIRYTNREPLDARLVVNEDEAGKTSTYSIGEITNNTAYKIAAHLSEFKP